MPSFQYGIAGLSQGALSPQSNVVAPTEKLIFSSRVKDIILDENHPEFEIYGEWSAIGGILIEDVSQPSNTNSITIAKPLFPNIKQYPLLNEVVVILVLPSTGLETNQTSNSLYYLPPLNIWGSQHHNAIPGFSELAPSQQKSYLQTSVGSTKKVTDEGTTINLGKGFIEQSNINPLQPYIGDYIIEGRFGNSIRFTSTNRQPDDFKDIQSPWSREGNNGSPLTIIRNGQQSTSGFDQFLPLYEDIDKDDSSIYMTTTQNIGITLASTNLNSFGIDITPQVKTSARIQRTPKGESGKSNNDSDNINITFDSVNVEPKGSSNSVSPNDLDELSNLSSNPIEFERDEIELTRSEEIEQQQRDRGGERDI